MSEKKLVRRRDFVAGVAGLGTLIGADLLMGCTPNRANLLGAGPSQGVRYFDRFGVSDALIRDTLATALATGADFADLFFQHRVATNLDLEDKEVKRAASKVELGVGVRVIKGDQTGYAFTEELTPEALKRAAATAASIAEGSKGRAAPAAFRVPSGLPQRYRMDVPWDRVTADQRIAVLNSASESILAQDPRVIRAKVSFSDQVGAILVADSEGRIIEDIQPMTTLRMTCIAEQNGRREDNFVSLGLRTGFEIYKPERIQQMARTVVDRTMILFDAAQPSLGEMPVVLGPGSSGVLLHEAIGHGMEADFNRKELSVFSDKIGKRVAHPFITIVDEGISESARGSLNVDDEGNVPGKTVLVENGILSSYLHDSISAKHYGLQPTGNGRRESYQFSPMPRMRSTYMLAGPHKKDEIIASVKKGIYCERLSNGQVNIGPGDFSFYLKNGYLIEDGKLTRPIKDVNLIGNGPKVLEAIDMAADDLEVSTETYTCGKDGQSVPVSVGMPTVRVASLTVGGVAKKG